MINLLAFVNSGLQKASGLEPLLIQKLVISLVIIGMLLFITRGAPVDRQKIVK
ncbi:MAG: hypothetical protein KTR30_14125 [Saprospiraceae bacterium]|nr:hypothetical protein [Saprospiraceae bacterium]